MVVFRGAEASDAPISDIVVFEMELPDARLMDEPWNSRTFPVPRFRGAWDLPDKDSRFRVTPWSSYGSKSSGNPS